MIVIPTWLLFVLIFSIVILFVFYEDLSKKVNRTQFEQLQIGMIVNKSFIDITNDMELVNKGLDQMNEDYDKIKNRLSKINS